MDNMSNSQRLSESLELKFAKDAEANALFLPTDDFCVRKPAAIFADGRYWIYADVIPWNHKFWPDTYDTSIHAFSSTDCRKWKYHGEVVGHREPNAWDYGGVATPGAIAINGRVHIFYSGRETFGPNGHRWIGMAVADNPAGPFVKMENPAIVSDHPATHLDDPIPVPSSLNDAIELYFRQAEHEKTPPSPYSIRRSVSNNGGETWIQSEPVLESDKVVRALETAEVKRIGDKIMLTTFDHLHAGGCKTAFRLSNDGLTFKECDELYLDDHLCRGWSKPACMLQIVLIPDEDGICRHMGITRQVDDVGHYNLRIYDIEPLTCLSE